jgi:hypothetical protein
MGFASVHPEKIHSDPGFVFTLKQKISDLLIRFRAADYEGKCELCRAKDRTALIKKQAEGKRKRKEIYSKLKEAVGEAAAINTTIREVKKNIDSEISDGGSTAVATPEETAPGAKLLEQFPTPNLPYGKSTSPSIKVENEDGTFSYEKWKFLESAKEAGQITEKQRTGEAGIGSWIPVKWVAVNSRGGNGDNTDSATDGVASDEDAKTGSSEFAIGRLLGRLQ